MHSGLCGKRVGQGGLRGLARLWAWLGLADRLPVYWHLVGGWLQVAALLAAKIAEPGLNVSSSRVVEAMHHLLATDGF